MTTIILELTDKEIQSLQNGLAYASWQFYEGGDSECDADAETLDRIYKKIIAQTGIESEQ